MDDKVILRNSNTLLNDDVFFPDKSIIDYGEIFMNYSSDKESLFIKNDNDEVISFRSKNYNYDKINKSLPVVTYSKDMPSVYKEGDLWVIPIDSSQLVYETKVENESVKITNNGSLFNYIEIDGSAIDLEDGEIYFTFSEIGEHTVNVEINESVRDVIGIFKDCVSLKTINSDLFEQCTLISSFESSFEGCLMLTNIPKGIFDTNTLCQSFKRTFYGCESIVEIPSDLFKFNVNAIDFSYVFYGCSSIYCEIPSMLFGYCQKAKDFSYSMCGCSKVYGVIPFDMFLLCKESLNFEGTFMGCESITGEISTSLFSVCTKAENFSKTFMNCSSITSIKSGAFNTCIASKTFNSTFSGCESLISFPKYIFSNCTKVTDFSEAFKGCFNMFEVSPRDSAFGIELPLYDRNKNEGYAIVENFNGCYNGCINLTDYDDIPNDWK